MSLKYLLALLGSVTLVTAQAKEINTPIPMLPNPHPSCEQFGLASPDDNCTTLIYRAQIAPDVFHALNPGIGGEAGCAANIIPGTWYCFKALPQPPPSPKAKSNGPQPPPSPKPKSNIVESTPTPEPEPEVVTHGEGKLYPEVTPTGTLPMTGVLLGGPNDPNVNPATTPIPAAPYVCLWGPCWRAFLELVTEEKSSSESQMARMACGDLFQSRCIFKNVRLPEDIKEGCQGCEILSSACPCFLENKYHTYTVPFDKGGNSETWDMNAPGIRDRTLQSEEILVLEGTKTV